MPDVLKEFGQKVRQYRTKKGLSQEKLSEIADMERSYIAQIETGRRNIALKNISKLAKALNLSIKDLFDHEKTFEKK